jgi:hypothetical protein
MDITKVLPALPIPDEFLVQHCTAHDYFMRGCQDCLLYDFVACLADNIGDFEDASCVR